MIYRTSTDFDEEGWNNLANGIILRAVEDYRHTLRRLKKQPDDQRLQKQKIEIEEFFFSGWFGMLTDLDGKLLLRQLRSEMNRAEEEG